MAEYLKSWLGFWEQANLKQQGRNNSSRLLLVNSIYSPYCPHLNSAPLGINRTRIHPRSAEGLWGASRSASSASWEGWMGEHYVHINHLLEDEASTFISSWFAPQQVARSLLVTERLWMWPSHKLNQFFSITLYFARLKYKFIKYILKWTCNFSLIKDVEVVLLLTCTTYLHFFSSMCSPMTFEWASSSC